MATSSRPNEIVIAVCLIGIAALGALLMTLQPEKLRVPAWVA